MVNRQPGYHRGARRASYIIYNKYIILDYVNQVVLMSDNELNEDRSEWIKTYGNLTGEVEDDIKYLTSIHTIAIELEQLRRFKDIVYVSPEQITE